MIRVGMAVWGFVAAFLVPIAFLSATDNVRIIVPKFDDAYSRTVKVLESGKSDIDYAKFRASFLASKQFRIAQSRREELRRLKSTLPSLIEQNSFARVVEVTKEILSIDYTDMHAQKLLYQSYRALKDELNAAKYHDIEFGLLNSIIKAGDGKSCKTAWPVIQIEEEYFILAMMGASLRKQSTDQVDGLCDKMEVSKDGGREAVYYFGISALLGAQERLLH
jgi:hypothetical protein